MKRRLTLPLIVLIALVTAGCASNSNSGHGSVKTRDVKYTVGGTEYVGFLAVDESSSSKRPGVLVCPEWVGVNDYARGRAKQLAEMGYIAFVFDPYGGGKMAADVKQASEWATALKNDRPQLRARVNAAFATLKQQPQCDQKKTAAIGYCFGGTSALELARSGTDLLGVVSFHGALATPMPVKAGDLKAKILVCHGADDLFVPPNEVAGFEQEMRDAKADWLFVSYGNAVHSFTNPGAAKAGLKGVAYEERADKRSWQAMKDFFAEIFK
jgi:dienelactone hydrolase